jgi:hypothetical protein
MQVLQKHTYFCVDFFYKTGAIKLPLGLGILIYFDQDIVRSLRQVESETVDKIKICSSQSDHFSKAFFEYIFSSPLSSDLPTSCA